MHTKNITPGTSFFMISVTNPHFMLFFARPLLEIGLLQAVHVRRQKRTHSKQAKFRQSKEPNEVTILSF